jgi:hypothetical protein
MPDEPSPPRSFRARIERAGVNPYVDVPFDVIQAFGPWMRANRVRVSGTLNGAGIRGSLVPVRGRPHRLHINGGMRAASGAKVGDTVRLELRAQPDDSVALPADLAAALQSRPDARIAFDRLAPSTKREWIRHVDDARSPANRVQRIEGVMAELLGAGPLRRVRRADGEGLRERELWTCPRCGNRFVNRNQYHSCAAPSVDAFARRPSYVRDLFERFRAMVHAVGPVTEVAYRDRVAFMDRVRFAGATPHAGWLEIGFWLTRRDESPRFHRVETLGPMAHIHRLRIREPDELDAQVAGWIAESFAVGRQDHLRTPAGGDR